MPIKKSSKNPITFIGEKNKTIFTDVIPTIREVQRQKYAKDIKQQAKKDKQVRDNVKLLERKIERRFFTRDPKTNERKPLRLSELSPKTQKSLRRYLFLKIKKTNVEKLSSEQVEELLADIRRLLFDIKVRQNKKQLILKSTAKEQLLNTFVPEYSKLKDKDKKAINTIINYNLRLLTRQTYLTNEEYNQLREAVLAEIKKINTNYTVIEDIKKDLLSHPTTKRIFSNLTDLEKKRKLKFLDQLIRSTHNYATPKGRKIIERKFAKEMIGIKRK